MNNKLEILKPIQSQLEAIYEIRIEYDVCNFTFTDRTYADAVGCNNSNTPEQLLISQQEDYLNISLYLDNSILNQLQNSDPYSYLHENNLQAFWIAVEGVSHFLYVAWRARYDRPVSQLELELQAEIDKFVCATKLLSQQNQSLNLKKLWERLFRNYYLRNQMDAEQIQRYWLANQYAGKYCQTIQNLSGSTTLNNHLRRFYRLNQVKKIAHISATH